MTDRGRRERLTVPAQGLWSGSIPARGWDSSDRNVMSIRGGGAFPALLPTIRLISIEYSTIPEADGPRSMRPITLRVFRPRDF